MKKNIVTASGTLIPLALAALLFVSGCSNRATATLSPGADLSKVKTFYVVHQPKDTHSIHHLISDKLVMEGYSATAGPELPQSSYKVDSIVTYVDRWMWDITLYLLELTVTFRDATNGFPLAVGNSYHTSLTRKSPQEMVDEVLTNILNTSKQTGAIIGGVSSVEEKKEEEAKVNIPSPQATSNYTESNSSSWDKVSDKVKGNGRK
jgi:hypothetical protein